MYRLDLNLDNYPMLKALKKDQLSTTIELIVKTGYETIFPSKPSIDPLYGKITSLESTLERLMGIGSSKKGEMAELVLENHIKNRYGDVTYIDMAHTPHSGDAWIKFDNNTTNILLESKNYTNKVNKDEIDKMKFDMIHCNIKWGIFLSWNSNIIGMKEFDIEMFQDKGMQYNIIYIANLSSDIDRLDLAIQLIRKLITMNFTKNITWIQSIIENDLLQLNNIISKNYQFRIWFEDMDTSIKHQLNKYYSKMREYMFEIDNSIKNISERIMNSTLQSINVDHDSFNQYLSLYKDNKKLFPVLAQLVDTLKQYSITVKDDIIYYKDTVIASIKVMGKKILIVWETLKQTSELGMEDNTSSFTIIKILLESIVKSKSQEQEV